MKLSWARPNTKWIYRGEEEELTKTIEWWRCVSRVWSEQVDAAAKVEVEVKSDGGGRARASGWREEDDKTKRHEGKMTLVPIYKVNG